MRHYRTARCLRRPGWGVSVVHGMIPPAAVAQYERQGQEAAGGGDAHSPVGLVQSYIQETQMCLLCILFAFEVQESAEKLGGGWRGVT